MHAMTGEELEAEIATSLKDYNEMELKLFPKQSASPYQIPRHMRFFAPQGRGGCSVSRAATTSGEEAHSAGAV